MRILPVIDLKGGRVVRGHAGRRHDYRPLVSRLTSSCDPIDVVRALRDTFEWTDYYLADLDAIAGAPPSFNVYAAIHSLGCRLWLDAGARQLSDVASLAAVEVGVIVLGLETIDGPSVVAEACMRWSSARIAFSLDLKGGAPLGDPGRWSCPDPFGIAAQAVDAGVRTLLILDLERVGTGAGAGTEELCVRLTRVYPQVEVVAGGGVRDAADVRRLHACGVQRVLAATALHDGRIGPEEMLGRPRQASSGAPLVGG